MERLGLYFGLFCLSILQGFLMRKLKHRWDVYGVVVYPSPLYAAWGIGWLVTILWATDRLNYFDLWSSFFICFPGIYWGSIPNETKNTADSFMWRSILELRAVRAKIKGLGG